MKFKQLLVPVGCREWPRRDDLRPYSAQIIGQPQIVYARAVPLRPGYDALVWVTQWPEFNTHWLHNRSFDEV